MNTLSAAGPGFVKGTQTVYKPLAATVGTGLIVDTAFKANGSAAF
jgi:hypothetical protein